MKKLILLIAACLVLTANPGVFAESKPQPEAAAQPAAPPATPATLNKADLDAIQKIVDDSVGEQIRPVIRSIAEMNQEKGPGFTEIVGGIGYIFGILGVVLFFMSRKEGK